MWRWHVPGAINLEDEPLFGNPVPALYAQLILLFKGQLLGISGGFIYMYMCRRSSCTKRPFISQCWCLVPVPTASRGVHSSLAGVACCTFPKMLPLFELCELGCPCSAFLRSRTRVFSGEMGFAWAGPWGV